MKGFRCSDPHLSRDNLRFDSTRTYRHIVGGAEDGAPYKRTTPKF
jgi:hypothetical protein